MPNERALFPPLCICRMMKIQKPIMRRIGAQAYSSVAQGLLCSGFAWIWTLRSISLLPRPSYCGGAYVRNFSLGDALVVPVISFPWIVTDSTSPASTMEMKWLNETGWSFP